MSTRLSAICALIPQCGLLLDVGCDHGKLAEYAASSGLCGRVIASDVSPGSLQKAEKRLARYANAETRLGWGLRVLRPEEDPDVIVIAGMGGCLIIDILHGYTGGAKLILGAQKDACRLRTFLSETGYRISEDFTVEDRGKFYDVIGAERGRCRPDEMQKKFGVFYKLPNPALLARCRFDLARLAGTPNDVKDIEEVIKWQLR